MLQSPSKVFIGGEEGGGGGRREGEGSLSVSCYAVNLLCVMVLFIWPKDPENPDVDPLHLTPHPTLTPMILENLEGSLPLEASQRIPAGSIQSQRILHQSHTHTQKKHLEDHNPIHNHHRRRRYRRPLPFVRLII